MGVGRRADEPDRDGGDGHSSWHDAGASSGETFARIAQNAAVTLPVEQTIVWDSFDAAMSGREPWGRVVYERPDGSPRALLSLTRMSVRGFPYLWARHAPVWLNGAH